MNRTRTGTPASTAGSFDAGAEALLPVQLDGQPVRVTHEPARARRSWPRIAVRLVRDAAIAVALMASVPIGIVATRGERVWRGGTFSANVRTRLKQSEVARSLALPVDPSITPMQAGLAFAALGPTKESADFPAVAILSPPEATWRNAPLTPGMFISAAPDLYQGPSSKTILEAVSGGFSPQELAYLRTLATAPVWRDFDIVARAQTVDFIGGRFIIPFAPNASAEQMPLANFKATKEMAYAAVSRAAYHMAIGQRDSAEMVLRSIVSVGFAMIDDGTTLIDELIGLQLVGIGRDALGRFYVITSDPRAGTPAVAPPERLVNSTPASTQAAPRPSVDDLRQQLIARTADQSAHRGERFEALHMLSASSCTYVRELLFGARTDVTDAFRHARGTLARYPSEQALVDLLGREPQPRIAEVSYDPIQALAFSASTVAGVVLRNPRLAACSRTIGGYYGGR